MGMGLGIGDYKMRECGNTHLRYEHPRASKFFW
jgi:hypothetical protein